MSAKPALDRAFDQADAGVAELIHPVVPRLYDKTALAQSLDAGSQLSYGAALATPNPVSAASLAEFRGLSAIFIDAAAAERGQISAVVKAVQHVPALVIGKFRSASDPFLKPKMDEGLLGALLENAGGLKQTLKFLRRLYVPPLGLRSVGPADVTGYLRFVQEFIDKNNGAVVGGVSISDSRGVRNIEAIVKAKRRGLRLIQVDSKAIALSLGVAEGSAEHQDAVARVEKAAREAGIPLAGAASSRDEAVGLYRKGYRHVIVGGDEAAVDAGFQAFEDVPADLNLEPPIPLTGGARRIKAWLKAGRISHLAFLMTPDLNLARRMAQRAHALWIDAEAGQFPLAKIKEIIAALPSGSSAVVRTTQYDNPDIQAYLAAGAAAVVAPQVSTAWQARAFVAAVKRADPQALAVVMIETRQGLENIEAIARVPGVDVLFIGPYDLSLSLNVKMGSEGLKVAVARIEAAARAAGVPLGGLAATRSQSYQMQRQGYGLVTSVSDQGAIARYFKKALEPSAPSVGPGH